MNKYIFLDIDGTIVDFDGRMPESARESLMRAQSLGCKLIAATGRFYGQIYPWLLDEIEFDGFLTSSGASIRYGGKRIFEQFMQPDELGWLVSEFARIGAPALYHVDDSLITTEAEFEAMHDFFERSGLRRDECDILFGKVRFTDVRELDCIEKAVYFDSKRTLDEMRTLLNSGVGEGFKLDPFSYRSLPPTCGEVVLASVSKATAIARLIERLGVPREDTIAIGDGGNDFEMIEYAGVGIAMGNASDELKAVADHVTDDISRDGLAKAIEWIQTVG
ncbi:MAG: Cof-type HAD-IIB family hydrolase [Clostridiales bacterium]|nr:Cof-type HAD-IIB family hydrolase [Clostridiales bacterium]